MKVSEMGEFGLIDYLEKMVAEAKVNRISPDEPVIGIGDDAAAWRCGSSMQLATLDTMVENVHFSPETTTWKELGWKSLAINLSDIAAMGGVPKYALIALALPGDTQVEAVSRIYEGIIDLAQRSIVAIVGGNITRAQQISITITVFGASLNGRVLRRSAAIPGDIIAVTGYPGSAGAGREMLMNHLGFRPEAAAYLREAFLHPIPRITEGQLLVKQGITTAIDISDGIISDLRHVCKASQVSARVDIGRLPVHETVRANFGDRAEELALTGGEDYELLFTGSARAIERIRAEIRCPVTSIGKITEGEPGKINLFDAGGNPVRVHKTGWTHF